MRFKTLYLLGGLILLAACSPAQESVQPTAEVAKGAATPAVVSPTATTPPTATTLAAYPPPVADTASPAAGDPSSTVVFGRNDDGTFFHGAPDAPVTFIDFSDFL